MPSVTIHKAQVGYFMAFSVGPGRTSIAKWVLTKRRAERIAVRWLAVVG